MRTILHLAIGAATGLLLACASPRGPAPASSRPQRFRSYPAAPPPDPARKVRFRAVVPKLDKAFADMVREDRLPGMAIGIVLDGELVYAKGFGYQNLERKVPFDPNTLFPIASVTKGFTAMALLKLRDEGKIDFDRPAVDYYPPLASLAYPTRDSSLITIRQLLTHGSGLPEDNNAVDASDDLSEEQLLKLLNDGMTFSRAPNIAFEYSNTGYAILGQIIKQVTGMPAEEYIRREILLPLGMTRSMWHLDQLPADRVVLGYRGTDGYGGKDTSYNVAPRKTIGAYAAAGAMVSTIPEMGRYLEFLLSAWPPRDEVEAGPLRRSSVREMQVGNRLVDWRDFSGALLPGQQPAFASNSPKFRAAVQHYGFALFTSRTCDDDNIVFHSGGLPGYTTLLSLNPERNFGIIAFLNDERGSQSPTNLATEILRNASVIDPLPSVPVPALDSAAREMEHLLATWDEDAATRLFDRTFWHYQTKAVFHGQLAELSRKHGRCHAAGSVMAATYSRGTVHFSCERGGIDLVPVLSPDAEPRLQTLIWQEQFPVSPLQQRAAAAATAWLTAWKAADARAWLRGDADEKVIRANVLRTTADHSGCTLAEGTSEDGDTAAEFNVKCSEGGALVLNLAVDPKTEKLTKVHFASPRLRNCRP